MHPTRFVVVVVNVLAFTAPAEGVVRATVVVVLGAVVVVARVVVVANVVVDGSAVVVIALAVVVGLGGVVVGSGVVVATVRLLLVGLVVLLLVLLLSVVVVGTNGHLRGPESTFDGALVSSEFSSCTWQPPSGHHAKLLQ